MTRSHKPHALVTDGLWRKSLSAIRSLGKSGFDVTVMGDSWFTTGFWSRYTKRRLLAPLASHSPERFGISLLNFLEKNPGMILLPMEDPTLEWVSKNREALEKTSSRFLIPSEESLNIAQDKAQTLAVAESLKLPCPRTWRPETAQEFADLAMGLALEGFVAKPRNGCGSAGVVYGNEASTQPWPQFWRDHWDRFGPMLIQERIPAQGRGQGVSLLFDSRSECIATFAHERIEQYPNSGGPSTDRRSIHAPELIEWSIALLKRLHWKGIAMVEWKVDPRDGVPKLMEINPRFWGSLELAVRAGVDFPALYARAAAGEKLEPRVQYPKGVRCRWMIPGEVLRYVSQKPGKREGMARFLRGLPHSAEEWDPEDLRGFFSAALCTAAYALNPRYWKYLRRG